MTRRLSGLVLVAFLTSSLTAFGADDPPPPPPPPPPIEETGPVDTTSSEGWSIKGPNGLLDKGAGHVRKPMLSFFIGVPFSVFGYGYGLYVSSFSLGFGARFYLPIVKEGFLPMLNDSFGIEFGIDPIIVFGGFGYGTAFAFQIPVEARWNFHVFPRLEAYAKLGLGLGMFFGGGFYAYPVLVANVGVLFKLSDVISLRAEFGSPAVKVGVGIAF